MDAVIAMNGVSKVFKGKKAVDNITFSIEKGSVTAILGPNGAGKTTAIMMMLGLLDPSEGTISIFGQHPKDKAVREKTGSMLQEVSVMDRLKVKEIISLISSYYPHPMEQKQLVEATGLVPGDLNRFAEKLSGGQKRSLGFALALAGNPDLLFFDEPTVGLDITSRRRFWEKVRVLSGQGKTILFTTHYLQEAEDIADRILLFNRGSLAADGSPDEIKARIVKRSLSFLLPTDGADLQQQLLSLPAIDGCYHRDGRIFVTTEDTDEALRDIFTSGLPVKDVRIDQGRLDEAFEQLTMNQEEAG